MLLRPVETVADLPSLGADPFILFSLKYDDFTLPVLFLFPFFVSKSLIVMAPLTI